MFSLSLQYMTGVYFPIPLFRIKGFCLIWYMQKINHNCLSLLSVYERIAYIFMWKSISACYILMWNRIKLQYLFISRTLFVFSSFFYSVKTLLLIFWDLKCLDENIDIHTLLERMIQRTAANIYTAQKYMAIYIIWW